MPTYDYKCEECGHKFEKFQYIKDEPIKICPKCGGQVKRLIGPGAGIIFRGSGFYITDYRSESYKKSAKKDEGTGKATEAVSSSEKKDK